MEFEQKIRQDLRQYLESMQEIDSQLPECPDVEALWTTVGEDYITDGIREFAAYPTVSLGWIMFVGMAVAHYWDTDWDRLQRDPHVYPVLRDQRGFDHTDDYILEEVLQLGPADRRATSRLVGECAGRTYALLRHEHITPGSNEAFRAYVSCLRQLYLMGMSVQLKRLGYRMTRIGQ